MSATPSVEKDSGRTGRVRRVLKWDVRVDDQVHEIGSGQVVHVASQFGDVAVMQVWTLEDGADPTRRVQAFGTGQPLPDEVGRHLGTVLTHGGHLVWHLFEVSS